MRMGVSQPASSTIELFAHHQIKQQTGNIGAIMMDQQIVVCERLKRMGYTKDRQIRMYGEEFELISDPITISDKLFVVDAIERKSRSLRRVCIPLSIINMLRHETRAA